MLAGSGLEARAQMLAAPLDGALGAESEVPFAVGWTAAALELPASEAPRRHVIVRLPVARDLPNGTLLMEPNVEVADAPPYPLGAAPGEGWPDTGAGPNAALSAWRNPGEVELGPFPDPAPPPPGSPVTEPLPAWSNRIEYFSPSGADAEPMFEQAWWRLRQGPLLGHGLLATLFGRAGRAGEPGIGHERLVYAPFEIETTAPLNNFRFRLDSVHGVPWPDRAEYFWSKPGRGPAADTGVSYQDFRICSEVAAGTFSAATDIPIRLLDPDNDRNTAGLGDMNLTTKLVLLDGRSWQITQFLRTYFPTGAPHKGLSTGHVSMEPGFLFRYQWSPELFLNSELRYWFPLGADPVHAGQVLRYGLGYSYLLYETDRFAVLHTGEFVSYWFLYGQKVINTLTGQTASVDDEASCQFYPGLRFVFDRGCDFGLFELGLAGTFSTGSSSLFDPLLRLELRWSY
jgi:hypothetical protein